jgi:uncharacterized protein YjbI with pentapeptide repeats
MKLRSPAVLTAIGVIATLVLAVAVVMVLLRTGGAKAVSDNAALIGALVALGGVFTAQMVSIALDDRRTRETRELEAQRANETALQNYFEQVGTLLIEQRLRRASPGDNLSTLVRAQTLTVLEGLDPDRKRILLQFLYESALIYKDKPVVSLVLADLSRVALSGAYLARVDLSAAALRKAILSKAVLNKAILREAFLNEADLSEADLSEADLGWANLIGANLEEADLRRAKLDAAYLSGANLRGAKLDAAYLKGSHLVGANLTGAAGITNEELEQHAYSLEGAIMPDGSKHP